MALEPLIIVAVAVFSIKALSSTFFYCVYVFSSDADRRERAMKAGSQLARTLRYLFRRP